MTSLPSSLEPFHIRNTELIDNENAAEDRKAYGMFSSCLSGVTQWWYLQVHGVGGMQVRGKNEPSEQKRGDAQQIAAAC
jgi:hypothetical protein